MQNEIKDYSLKSLRQDFKAAGVKRLKPHALRHTFATLMIESKADLKTTSMILGHSSVGITADIYVHPTLDTQRRAISKSFKGLLDL